MSTLLDRARSIIAAPSARAAVLALTPLAAATANADLGTWTLTGARAQWYDNFSGSGWQDYASPVPTVSSSQLPGGLKLFGTAPDNNDGNTNAFSISGAQYIPSANPDNRGNRIILSGTAVVSNWDPAQIITTHFKFNTNFNEGVLDLYNVSTSYAMFNASHDFLGGGGSSGFDALGLEAGSHDFEFQYVDAVGPNTATGVLIEWSIFINFDWSNFAADDVLNFNIPANSIDINASIPTPASAALLGLAGVVASRRRRA